MKSTSSPPLQWRTQLWQRFLLRVMTGATTGVQRMSPSTARRFGSFLGGVGFRVAKRSRQIAMANLKLAHGSEISPGEIEQRTRRIFQHFGRGAVEFLRAPSYSKEELARRVSCTGWEHVEAAHTASKGAVLVTAHLGNWEIMGRWLASIRGIPLTVVARDPEDAAFALYIRQMREGAGFRVLSKGEAARGMLRALQSNEFVLILADQNSGDLFAPFFGVPAGTVAGPASLALHSGRPLIPIFNVVEPDGFLKVICFPPIDAPADVDRKEAVRQMMAEYNRLLEGVVRQYPEQWLWLHNRWKSAFEEHNKERAWGDMPVANCR